MSRRTTRGGALGAMLWLCACSRPDVVPSSASNPYVLAVDAAPTGEYGAPAWVDAAVQQQLGDAEHFADEGSGARLPARMRYEELRTDDQVPVLRVHLLVEPDEALAAQLDACRMVLDAYVELERRDQTIELRRDLPVALERAVALLDAKVTAVRGEPESLRALLTDSDPEVVLIGLDGVERRGVSGLADPVHALLGHGEDRVALRAMECLAVVGGPEHAAGLVRAAHLSDRAHAHRLYDALARLGGEHARGFLEFAARNEEDPQMALLVERALARLEATEPRSSARSLARGHRQ